MSKIAQIAEHASIGEGAQLACLVGVVGGMRTDEGENSLENRFGQLNPGRVTTALVQCRMTISIIAAIILPI